MHIFLVVTRRFSAVVVKEMSSFHCKLFGKEYNGKMVYQSLVLCFVMILEPGAHT